MWAFWLGDVPVHIQGHTSTCVNMSVCWYVHVYVCTCTITVSERKYTGLERGSKLSTVLVALVYDTLYCRLLGDTVDVLSLDVLSTCESQPPHFRPIRHLREGYGVLPPHAIQSGSPVYSVLATRYLLLGTTSPIASSPPPLS